MSTADLTWGIIRNDSCFIVKRNGVTFNRQPGNLLNKNSFRFSNAANKPVLISPAASGATVVLKKHKSASSDNSKALYSVSLSKNSRKSAKSLSALLKYYRPDLQKAAKARVARILESQKEVKPKKAPIRKGRKKSEI